jgi:hypothetical protein
MAYRERIKGLFERIATDYFQHTDDENHFCPNGFAELIEKEQSGLYSDALVLEGYDIKYIDRKSGNLMKKRTVGFWILRQVESDRYDVINACMDELEEKGDTVFNRFKAWRDEMHKSIGETQWLNSVFKDFDMNEVEVSEVKCKGDNWYGYFYTIPLTNQVDTSLP